MSRNDVLPDPNNVVTATHIVRQPIYDANVQVDGYELIVHGDSGQEDAAAAAGAVMQIGLNLVAGGLAWVPPHARLPVRRPRRGAAGRSASSSRSAPTSPPTRRRSPPSRSSAAKASRSRSTRSPRSGRLGDRGARRAAEARRRRQDRREPRPRDARQPTLPRPPGAPAHRRQERRDARGVRDLQVARLRPLPGLLLLPAARGREQAARGEQPQQAAPDRRAAGPGRRHRQARRDRHARRRPVLQPAALRQLGLLLGAAPDRVDQGRARPARPPEREALGHADGAGRRATTSRTS